jgi:hypothetical protein
MDFNELALVVFFVTLCLYKDVKTIMMVLAVLICMWFLTTINAQQLMNIEGMQNNGNTTSLTVYLLFIVIVVLFLKRVI